MDVNNFLFDKFFVYSSVYTVDFVMPEDHDDILVDLIQLSIPFRSLFLVQGDFHSTFRVTFVSAYSLGEFYDALLSIVEKIRTLHNLTYKQFHFI